MASLILSLLALAIVGTGLIEAAPSSRPRGSQRVDALAAALVESAALPSISIAIARDGQVQYAQAFGFADIEGRIPATVNTQYRCASVSKVITATAIGRLVQAGRLDLDAPVSRYVPSWPSDPMITPRLLAGHLAGVGHYAGEDRLERQRHYESVTAALDVFRESPRAGAPGESYTYSTHGFTLLAAVAEGAAGDSFLGLLDQEVFVPLGMESSGPDDRTDLPSTMSTLYGRRRREPFPIPRPEDPSYKWAGGGLISTPSDLVRMATGYLDGTLSPEVVDEMWGSQRTTAGEETGVGVAWRIGEDEQGRRVIHHSGSMGGARSTIVIWPDEGESIAVMTNVGWSSNIMETGLLLMEAYRSSASVGASFGSGEFEYTGEFMRSGKTESTTGTIVLEADEGWITMPTPFAEWTGPLAVERMPVHHLDGNRYALVSPFGLMSLELESDASGVRGRMDLGSTQWRFHAQPR